MAAKPVLKSFTSIKASSASYSSIKISWSGVSGATGYKIYRSTSKDGKYDLLKTLGSSSRSYTNTGVTTGKKYYYRVDAQRYVSSTVTIIKSAARVSAYAKLSTPVITVKKDSSTKVKISWNYSYGASGYVIYKSTSKNGTYSAIKTITNGKTLSYINSYLKKNSNYYYKIKAYRLVNGKKVYSECSTIRYIHL